MLQFFLLYFSVNFDVVFAGKIDAVRALSRSVAAAGNIDADRRGSLEAFVAPLSAVFQAKLAGKY